MSLLLRQIPHVYNRSRYLYAATLLSISSVHVQEFVIATFICTIRSAQVVSTIAER
jgi:hypothetical protein